MKDLRYAGTERIEILCHPVRVDESEALDRSGDLFSRLLFGPRRERHASLLYKPFWYSETGLPDTSARKNGRSARVFIMVDGLTGITRDRKKEPQEPEPIVLNVEKEKAYPPEVGEEEAKSFAQRFLQRLNTKASGEVGSVADPKLIFRPIWLVENPKKRRCYAVDAYTGYIGRNFIVPQRLGEQRETRNTLD